MQNNLQEVQMRPPMPHNVSSGKILGIIDLGSNSARLLLVQVLPSGAYTILNRVKHMVRLGENAFETKQLQENAMQRTLLVLRAFMDMCRKYNVTQMLPIATAAVRDANNSADFLQRVHDEAGLDLRVISGKEEARLIYTGVLCGLPFSHALRTFIDIGGGSTEVAIANTFGHESLDSLKLGCVRLTNRFLAEHEDQVTPELFAEMCNYVSSRGAYVFTRVQSFATAELVASSGTALALHAVAFRMAHGVNPSDEQNTLTLANLKEASKYVCKLTANERSALPGVNARRAQVLVAGAAILQTMMEELGFDKLTVSTRNLQDGILMDYLSRKREDNKHQARSVREQSVLQLAQRCNFEERHSRHIANLALQLHDSAVDCALINLDHQARELLYYTALLHDIGIFISYSRHAFHGAYFLNNTDLLGFTDDEIRFMAEIIQMHNLKPTKKNEDLMQGAIKAEQRQKLFALFIALAENMDRLHCQHIQEAAFSGKNLNVALNILVHRVSPIEIDAVEAMSKLLCKGLEREVKINFTTTKRVE